MSKSVDSIVISTILQVKKSVAQLNGKTGLLGLCSLKYSEITFSTVEEYIGDIMCDAHVDAVVVEAPRWRTHRISEVFQVELLNPRMRRRRETSMVA